MTRSQGLLPFMDVLTGLVGIIILINVILAVDLAEKDKIPVRVLLKEEDAPAAGVERRPVYVICSSAGLLVGEDLLPNPESREQFKDLSRAVTHAVESAGESGYVLALIRPDGYKSFEGLRGVVNNLGFRLGYEPVSSDWELVRQ
ncbi:MAG: hypothetical protein V1792_20470 [Pseudomonadota bacterium]